MDCDRAIVSDSFLVEVKNDIGAGAGLTGSVDSDPLDRISAVVTDTGGIDQRVGLAAAGDIGAVGGCGGG